MEKKEGIDQTGTKEKRKKIDLSVPQVAGSAVAAVMAAKLASSFGVYGTILGAGLISVVATCGGPVFQHFFSRTGEQVREAAEKAKPKARQVPVTEDGSPVPSTFRAPATTGTGPVTTSWRPGLVAPAEDATAVLPAADTDRTQLLATAGADAPEAPETLAVPEALAVPEVPGGDDKTQLLAAIDTATDATRALPQADPTMMLRTTGADPTAADPTGADSSGADAEETRLLAPVSDAYNPSTTHGKRIKSWKRPLLGAALVFGVTMGGIATYELVSGDSFSGNDSRVLRPSSWGDTSDEEKGDGGGEERRDDGPKDTPGTTAPTEGATPGTGDRAPGTDPTAVPDRDRESGGGTKPTPTPDPTRSDRPTPTPTPTHPDEPTPTAPSPELPTEGADPGQDRQVAPTG